MGYKVATGVAEGREAGVDRGEFSGSGQDARTVDVGTADEDDAIGVE